MTLDRSIRFRKFRAKIRSKIRLIFHLPVQMASCVLKHKKCFLCFKTNLPPTRVGGLQISSKVGNLEY